MVSHLHTSAPINQASGLVFVILKNWIKTELSVGEERMLRKRGIMQMLDWGEISSATGWHWEEGRISNNISRKLKTGQGPRTQGYNS